MVDSKVSLTVGKLRQDLAEMHESQEVVISENNLLFRVKATQRQTAMGFVTVLERGDPVVW